MRGVNYNPSLVYHPATRPRFSAASLKNRDTVECAVRLPRFLRINKHRQVHNGYRTICDNSKLAHLHPSSACLALDDDGLLPEWIIYHEFLATSKPFLNKVLGSLKPQLLCPPSHPPPSLLFFPIDLSASSYSFSLFYVVSFSYAP